MPVAPAPVARAAQGDAATLAEACDQAEAIAETHSPSTLTANAASDLAADADATHTGPTAHTGPTHTGPTAHTEPTAPTQPVVPTEPTRAGPLEPGSLADLRRRLELLPYGHPSSPYHVDGERKSPPPRLRHLELAPPAPRRFTSSLSAGASANWPSLPGTDDEGWPEMPAPASADLPSADAAPGDGQPAELNGTSLNGSADHDDATARVAPPRPGTAPDGSWSWGSATLTRDQVQIADEAYDRFRAAEGRNLFGSYGSGGITTTMRRLADDLEYGQLAPDTEETALLEPDVFRARFAGMLRRYPERSPERLAGRVPAAISYSFIFEAERYSESIWLAQDALTAHGFQLLARRNDWKNAHNRCVATMWHDPVHELPFEVQFHTNASLAAQQLAKSSATLINDPRIPAAEAAHLKSDLAAAWAALPAPPGGAQITDFRRAPDGSGVPS
ncbi:MAG TPA: hypothetical protein VFQ44_31305 [Streptosporangiaceae bacterium]|nr:hypothetical protein [Streptosporangiaceae bacterium]